MLSVLHCARLTKPLTGLFPIAGLAGAVAALMVPAKAFAAQQFDENMESMRAPVNKKRGPPAVGSYDDQQDVLDNITADGDMQQEGRGGGHGSR